MDNKNKKIITIIAKSLRIIGILALLNGLGAWNSSNLYITVSILLGICLIIIGTYIIRKLSPKVKEQFK